MVAVRQSAHLTSSTRLLHPSRFSDVTHGMQIDSFIDYQEVAAPVLRLIMADGMLICLSLYLLIFSSLFGIIVSIIILLRL